MYTPYLGFLSSYTYVLKKFREKQHACFFAGFTLLGEKVLQIAGYNTAIVPL
jgi:hypothetical protein